MSKRFLSVTLAVLFGLVSAAELESPMFLVEVDDLHKVGCTFYDDLTIFDLKPLAKDNSVYSKSGFKFSFCKPFEVDVKNKTTGESTTEKTYSYKESIKTRYSDIDPAQKTQALEDENGNRYLTFQ